MKKNNIFVLLLIFPLLQAQELDPNFLNSLPDDIRNDILSKAQDNQELAEPNYRSSEFSSKLELEDSVFKLKEKLEDNLEELEKRLQSDKKIVDDIQVYGSDFFTTFQTSFMPTNEPNPDSSYRLDAGDTLKFK